MKKNILFILCLSIVCQLASARSLYVSKNGNDLNNGLSESTAFFTVEKAFLHLKDNDTIKIGEGVFTVGKTLEWGNKAIAVIGAGQSKTILQASELKTKDVNSLFTYSVFYNMPSESCVGKIFESLISGLTIRNGAAPISEPMPTGVGGGIRNFAKLKLKDCILEDNIALNGGAIYNGGSLTLENSIIRNNHAFNVMGGIYNAPGAVFEEIGNNIVENNTQDDLFNATITISDFESGFSGKHGTNGNAEGYKENSANFSIVDNPDKTGINSTNKVGKFKRLKNGDWWAYAWFEFPAGEVQIVPRYLHIMVRKPIASRFCVQLKDAHSNPNSNTGEIIVTTQNTIDEWQDLVFEIPNTGIYSYIEIKPDFVNATPSSRLEDDIEIYFDEIIIDGSPEPRTFTEEKLGGFPFPTETASLAPADVNEYIEISDLTYTANLIYDYNTGPGYFRPYNWPTGVKEDDKYLEFTVSPKEDMTVEITKLQLVHKPNTAALGPSKVKAVYSTNNKGTFTDLLEISFAVRTSLTTSNIQINGLKTNNPVTFRLYAYESLHGNENRKDLWIIDRIDLYGTAGENAFSAEKELFVANSPICYFHSGNLYVENINNYAHLSLFDLLGNQILQKNITNGESIPVNYPGNIFIVKLESAEKERTFKIIKK